ncbi:flagellar assembly protein FliH [Agarivorans sp. B2Z047]|uniref:flagellar assembly protein FliH n=1 Tax=Agarivorans sp. B2Z047 TaxID=2652721 RepID=UPI00128C70C9|nr:flagellar assembly protein FliH [Agarivorans sp. B2Z047]MPW28793.1 flagellar assembly protein FliH [Agarivorans sp. B2Z047]UQN41353.1 flagellar assembly protein FliH [Agarivorans sp. B2Z047]
MSDQDKTPEQESEDLTQDAPIEASSQMMDEDEIAALLEQNDASPASEAPAAEEQSSDVSDEQAAIDAMLADAAEQQNIAADQPANEQPSNEQADSEPEDDIAWPLPDFTDPHHVEEEPTSNVFNMKPAWFNEEPVEEEPEIQFEPMTIEELEALRQSAYEEGKAEGKAEGHKEGLLTGHEEGLEQGKAQGHQEGLSQGLSEGQQQIDQLSSRWQGLIDQLHQPNKQIDEEVEQQVVELATKLAAEIVQVELVTNPSIIAKTVKQAVAALPLQKQHIRIHLHPEDMAVIQAVFPPETQEKKNWQLLADGSLTQGDCLIENDLSSVSVDMNEVIKQSLQSFIRQNGQDDDAEPTT